MDPQILMGLVFFWWCFWACFCLGLFFFCLGLFCFILFVCLLAGLVCLGLFGFVGLFSVFVFLFCLVCWPFVGWLGVFICLGLFGWFGLLVCWFVLVLAVSFVFEYVNLDVIIVLCRTTSYLLLGPHFQNISARMSIKIKHLSIFALSFPLSKRRIR